jgi:hypothetical protein
VKLSTDVSPYSRRCLSGFKANERQRQFIVDDDIYEIAAVLGNSIPMVPSSAAGITRSATSWISNIDGSGKRSSGT